MRSKRNQITKKEYSRRAKEVIERYSWIDPRTGRRVWKPTTPESIKRLYTTLPSRSNPQSLKDIVSSINYDLGFADEMADSGHYTEARRTLYKASGKFATLTSSEQKKLAKQMKKADKISTKLYEAGYAANPLYKCNEPTHNPNPPFERYWPNPRPKKKIIEDVGYILDRADWALKNKYYVHAIEAIERAWGMIKSLKHSEQGEYPETIRRLLDLSYKVDRKGIKLRKRYTHNPKKKRKSRRRYKLPLGMPDPKKDPGYYEYHL